MNKEEAIAFLQTVFSWKYNSLAAYILAAEPFLQTGDEIWLERIKAAAAADKRAADAAVLLLEKFDAVPHVDPYPEKVAYFNYLALGYLRSVLVEEFQRQERELEKWTPLLESFPEVKSFSTSLLAEVRSYLSTLRDL